MVQWGLLAPDFRLKEFVLDLLTEQAAGYYDPKQQTFFIADWLPHIVQKPVMAHELVHALQDQHYNLQKILTSSRTRPTSVSHVKPSSKAMPWR